MNDYTLTEPNGQQVISNISCQFLMIPSFLDGFSNSYTDTFHTSSGRDAYLFHGDLEEKPSDRICPKCGRRMHINSRKDNQTTLRHLPFGSTITAVRFKYHQYLCLHCGETKMQAISFKAQGHRITTELEQYTRELLSGETYTLKDVAELTGLGKNTVKAIDEKRLEELYTDDGKTLKKPEKQAEFLGIDEFKLHDGHKFATHIIDLKTGHILWIAHGKKKQVVYDFINHVGMDWMSNVVAVACDMNSDFQEAFQEKCPHIRIVFDHFHIVKNFNEKVVAEVRKDEQRRLIEVGDEDAAKSMKNSKYILTSNRETLQKKDKEAAEGKVIRKGSELFGTEDVVRKSGYEERYDNLLKENHLLFMCDFIKEKLKKAYTFDDEARMGREIAECVWYCNATKNKHFMWFANLLMNHHDGIVSFATYKITSAKIEGINNKIKTLRRQGYGYPDDEYFFLKIIDASHKEYIRNPSSHRICD